MSAWLRPRLVLLLTASLLSGCADGPASDDTDDDTLVEPDVGEVDVNGNGSIDVLVIGTSVSVDPSSGGFAVEAIADELAALLEGDPDLDETVSVVPLDVYRTATLDTGYGGRGDLYTWTYSAHSLAQFLYWPEERDVRWASLAGEGTPWDHVVFAGDPDVVAQTPGYHALGVKRLADHVVAGGARPVLLMGWPDRADDGTLASIGQSSRRIVDLAQVELRLAPAALAWSTLDEGLDDSGVAHPSPNGVGISAATVYSQLTGRSATASAHDLDPSLAEAAWQAVQEEWGREPITGPRGGVDPFAACGIPDRALTYHQTGSSSERGIRGGLTWVMDQASTSLVGAGDGPAHFNYGRANTEFEADKRYRVDPSRFDFSVGFPMQDHGNTGNETLRYGLDQRRSPGENGTDLGVARHMLTQGELPQARAVPIRALFSQMHEVDPDWSAYRDAWHMHRDLDKASGAFLFTMLTGHCAVGDEPEDPTSDAWRAWRAHKIGYETAWATTWLAGEAPCLRVIPESKESTWTSASQAATLQVSFASPPQAQVTVRLAVSDEDAATVSPTELVFGPDDHALPQSVTLSGTSASETRVVLTATTRSDDPAFDAVVDRWEYEVVP